MLSKKQKVIILISGLLALLCGIVAAIPFRAFPGLSTIEGIAEIDLIVKLVVGALSIVLAIYPLIIKYSLMNKLRESSKVILIMVYFPILAFAVGGVINIIYTLSFDYLTIGMYAPLSAKVLSVIVAILAVYLVAAIYWIFSLHRIVIKVDKLANQLFDVFIFVSIVCIILLQFRINSLYNETLSSFEQYFLGTPFLFVIYLLTILLFGLGLNCLIKIIRKDETLIYYIKGDEADEKIRRVELNNAYNDTLDDFEQYFDENLEEYSKIEITEEEIVENLYPKQTQNIELVKINASEVEQFDFEEENLVPEDTEELKKVNEEKEKLLKEIEQKNDQLAKIRQQKSEIEAKEEELRNAKQAYENELAEYNQVRLEFAATPEEVEQPKKKEKKFSPTFEKMVEYANSFSDKEGFKCSSNAKGNLLKFQLGKKLFLVMQSTSSDYRISFITTPEKFVKYVTENPGTMAVPKNLSDNNWIKFTNKGKADPKLVKEIIKQAVVTAEKQIEAELLAKEEAKKAKALARKQEKAALKAAEQQN